MDTFGKHEGKRPLRISRHRWDNIKINFKESGCEGVV